MTLAALHILTVRHGVVTLYHEWLIFFMLCLIFGCASGVHRCRK